MQAATEDINSDVMCPFWLMKLDVLLNFGSFREVWLCMRTRIWVAYRDVVVESACMSMFLCLNLEHTLNELAEHEQNNQVDLDLINDAT